VATRELTARLHAIHLVAEALDRGAWPASVEILDGLAANVDAAARWALVVELEHAA
jgi:hypothetical protein